MESCRESSLMYGHDYWDVLFNASLVITGWSLFFGFFIVNILDLLPACWVDRQLAKILRFFGSDYVSPCDEFMQDDSKAG